MAKTMDITRHVLVPKHAIVSDAERKHIIDELKLTGKELPKILKTDPAIADLKAKDSDIIKITRKSLTAGEISFYRRVISN